MATRVIRFQASTTTTYIIEVGEEYFRFYVSGGQVMDGSSPAEAVHPYAAEDIATLQFRQINDIIIITHPDYPPGRLSRVTNVTWTYETIAFDTVPTLDENLSDTTITASDSTGSITLEASAPIFDPLHVGSFWRIGYKRETGMLEVFINADDLQSNGYKIFGTFNVRTYGVWSADVVLQVQGQDGSWEEVKRWRANDDRNIDVEVEAEEPAEYRLRIENYTSHTGEARVVMEWPEAIIYGTVQITSVSDSTNAAATVIEDLHDEPGWDHTYIPTPYWAEGAWSDLRGYPRACCVHEQRLIFGGTYYEPSTVWGSVTGDFYNFLYGVADDSAWKFQLAAEELNAVQWMESLNVLVIGTTGGEWRGRGNDLGDYITPTRRDFKQKTFFGSEYIAPVKVGDSTVLFIERKARKIRELFVNGDTFETADLTLLSEQVTRGGVQEIAWQGDLRILWAVMGSGDLYGLTYDREQDVAGWHRHITDGSFQSVCTVYGANGSDDEVWFVVERTVGSSTALYVERFDPTQWTSKGEAFMVDSGLTYEGSPEDTFTGLLHLAGRNIVGLADGVPFEAAVDESGAFSLPTGFAPASIVHAGLPYVALATPFRLDTDPLAGIHPGKTKRVTDVHLRVLDTVGGSTESSADGQQRALEYAAGDPSTDPELFSGDIPVDQYSGHEYDPTITIRQADPLPMTVTAVILGLSVSSS